MSKIVVNPGGPQEVYQEIAEAWAKVAGPELVNSARGAAGLNTGLLKKSLRFELVRAGQTLVVRFGSNLEYAKLHYIGRGPITAKPGHVLRWVDKLTGTVLFRKHVGPAAPNKYLLVALKVAGLRGVRDNT